MGLFDSLFKKKDKGEPKPKKEKKAKKGKKGAVPAAVNVAATPGLQAPAIPDATANAIAQQQGGFGETMVLTDFAGMPGMDSAAEVVKENGKLVHVADGAVIEITRESFSVGRSAEYNDYVIDWNTNISTTHGLIQRIEDIFVLQDLNSRNKVYHNNVELSPMDPVTLADGDSVKFADEEYIFHMPSDLVAAAPAPVAAPAAPAAPAYDPNAFAAPAPAPVAVPVAGDPAVAPVSMPNPFAAGEVPTAAPAMPGYPAPAPAPMPGYPAPAPAPAYPAVPPVQ
ncbi:MAG: FHA domain-containing protein [Bifidobacteriaceae bacterium]|jgi:hypothetical protein|nr:FHA domain-containing protein [Bifidobacteriaceae bacterium]